MPFSDITEHSLKYGALCAEFELGIKNLGSQSYWKVWVALVLVKSEANPRKTALSSSYQKIQLL